MSYGCINYYSFVTLSYISSFLPKVWIFCHLDISYISNGISASHCISYPTGYYSNEEEKLANSQHNSIQGFDVNLTPDASNSFNTWLVCNTSYDISDVKTTVSNRRSAIIHREAVVYCLSNDYKSLAGHFRQLASH